MLQSFIILFRETLEVALVIGIVLGYLVRSSQTGYRRSVYLGLAAGVGASILGALGFQLLAGGFSGRAEEIFEGTAMLLAAAVLTWMIFWMRRQAASLRSNLEADVRQAAIGGFLCEGQV